MKSWIVLLVIGMVQWNGGRVSCQSDFVWPLPQTLLSLSSDVVCFDNNGFKIVTNCDNSYLDAAVQRYQDKILFPQNAMNGTNYFLQINVVDCDAPLVKITNESYEMNMTKTEATMWSQTVWGAMRGLETFSQIVFFDFSDSCYKIDGVELVIKDFPRYPWRGLMLDSARHYLSASTIEATIAAMSYSKLNVMHWHVVDAQSFPLQVPTNPPLAEKGAYSYPAATFTPQDVEDIVALGLNYGVRVIIETDIPGHAASWGKGYPNIVANCPEYEANINNIPLDPSIEETYFIVENVLAYIAALVPDEFIHVGGDEVVENCWFQDPNISSWASMNGFTTGDEIYQYFEGRINNILSRLRKKRVVWEEAFLSNTLQPGDVETIVQVWKDSTTLQQVLSAGYEALQSYGFYLDQQIPSITVPQTHHYEWMDTWQDFYSVEPTSGLHVTPEELDLILGGEAAMWAETVDDVSISTRIWPRACATAERLWSDQNVKNIDDAVPRLNFHSCRLKRRGVPTNPIGPGYCDSETFIQF